MSRWINVNTKKPNIGDIVVAFYAWTEGSGKGFAKYDGDDWEFRAFGKVSEYKLGLCRVLFWFNPPPDPKYNFTISMGTDTPETINGIVE